VTVTVTHSAFMVHIQNSANYNIDSTCPYGWYVHSKVYMATDTVDWGVWSLTQWTEAFQGGLHMSQVGTAGHGQHGFKLLHCIGVTWVCGANLLICRGAH
jgi:hypothetical protein